ncbi:MAG: PQQ-dependent sugar dehydrogenase, partial [Planctomycetaceae bacterium]|nr:PQQ-dependent sugar dehydrogenase [Planctomycetaceae bacterium]
MSRLMRVRTQLIPIWLLIAVAASIGMLSKPLPAAAANEPREAWTTSRLQGAPVPPEPFQITPAFPQVKFDHPTCLLEIPGTDLLLVTEIGGKVWSFRNSPTVTQTQLVADLQSLANGGVSLFSAVADPDFAHNRFLYFCLVHPGDGRHSRVSRFTMTNDASPRLDPASETVIITWPSGGHNAGCLRFGPDGMLYIATGDGSGPNPPDGLTTGQDVSDLLGSILRIDVRGTTSGQTYQIPSDNPFTTQPGARAEVYAYGLRNPWKFNIDRRNGDVYVADNGWETWEMIHLVKAGSNWGWPVMEGRVPLRTEVAVGPTPITPPIRDHHHSEANSVIGGPVCHSVKLPQLDGHFIYGDYITGTIWSVVRGKDGQFIGQTLVDTDLRITDFLETEAGDVLVVDYDLTGQIYQLQPNTAEDRSTTFPRTLSRTGLFESLTPLQPATGVISYQVIAPRWMDGAAGQRFVAIPGTDSIQLAPHSGQAGTYPDGTVLVKHLTIPSTDTTESRPLETQILLLQNGTWNPYVYLWNANGSDADLVPPNGAQTPVSWPATDGSTKERTWHSGSANECRLCHNAGSGNVLGFVASQLTGRRNAAPDERSPIRRLLQQGTITAGPDSDASADYRLVAPSDQTEELNDRARSYLHANCSMCHHRGGNAIVSFYLSRNLAFEQLNTNKGTGIGTFGMTNAKIIVPGDPYRSVLMYRFSKLGNGRMPYIGSYVVDSEGVTLLESWIRSLSSTGQLSDPLISGTSQATALSGLPHLSATSDEAQATVRTLLSSTEGALALTAMLHADSSLSGLHPTVLREAANTSNDIRGLFDHFLPEQLRKKTLGRKFNPELVLTQQSDATRGQLIFFSDNARCRTCHHSSEPEQSVGPTLTDISRRYSLKSELLQHVMQPSLKIDDRFAAWTV